MTEENVQKEPVPPCPSWRRFLQKMPCRRRLPMPDIDVKASLEDCIRAAGEVLPEACRIAGCE